MKKHHSKNPFDAEEYAKLTGFDGKWRDTWWRKDFLEIVIKRCGLESPENLLDVGCGYGHWGRTLASILSPDIHVAGVDIEQDFADKAAEFGAAFGLSSMDYVAGNAENLPYEDNTFDLVTCQTVLIHVRDPKLVLEQMHRVLKPGGVLLIAEPNNLGGYFNGLLSEPRVAWQDILTLVDCYHTCVQGKKKLGFGDSTLGENLPVLVAERGYEEIRVAINEKCPALVPPYSSEEQQIWSGLEMQSGARMGFGPRENVQRFYNAGGGDEAKFAAIWELALATQRRISEAIENKTFSGSRGFPMYLISGRKPVLS